MVFWGFFCFVFSFQYVAHVGLDHNYDSGQYNNTNQSEIINIQSNLNYQLT